MKTIFIVTPDKVPGANANDAMLVNLEEGTATPLTDQCYIELHACDPILGSYMEDNTWVSAPVAIYQQAFDDACVHAIAVGNRRTGSILSRCALEPYRPVSLRYLWNFWVMNDLENAIL